MYQPEQGNCLSGGGEQFDLVPLAHAVNTGQLYHDGQHYRIKCRGAIWLDKYADVEHKSANGKRAAANETDGYAPFMVLGTDAKLLWIFLGAFME